MIIIPLQDSQSHAVHHYQYTSWPDSASPESASGIIDLIGQVSKCSASTGNKVVTVHCRYVDLRARHCDKSSFRWMTNIIINKIDISRTWKS